ncbi:hypothetical protein EBU95_15570 [bacterium]|nr:hypothetical protein [bacterium]
MLSATTITGSNISVSGNLNIAGTVVALNVTTTNIIDTNITAGIANITGRLAAIGNSNTIGTIVTTGGNVGIGTTSPSGSLHIKLSDASNSGVPVNWDNTYVVLGQEGSTNGALGIGYHSTLGTILNSLAPNFSWQNMRYGANLHIFNVNGNTRLTVNPAGVIITNLSTGTLVASTSVSSASIQGTNSTVTNAVHTALSSGTLQATTGITTGTLLVTGLISAASLSSTTSTLPNVVSTNVTTATIQATTGITTGTLLATTSISSASIQGSNSTITNAVHTALTTGTVNMTSAIASTGITSAALFVTAGGLVATFNSNTIGNIFTTGGNVGIGTTAPSVTLDLSSGTMNAGGANVTNITTGKIQLATPSTYPHFLYPSNYRILFGETNVSLNDTNSSWAQFSSATSSRNMVFAFSKTSLHTSYLMDNGSSTILGSEGGASFIFKNNVVYTSTDVANSGTTLMTITTSGVSLGNLQNTGITTATLLATTSISTGLLNGTNSTINNAVHTALSTGTLNVSSEIASIGITAGTLLITSNTVQGLVVGTNSNTTPSSVVIQNSYGNVEIGTVNSSGSFSSNSIAGDAVIRTSSNNNLILQTGTGNAGIYVATSGNIGIGTNVTYPWGFSSGSLYTFAGGLNTYPQYALDVGGRIRTHRDILVGDLNSNDDSYCIAIDARSTTGYRLGMVKKSGLPPFFCTASNNNFRWYSESLGDVSNMSNTYGHLMTLTTTSRLGIGTSVPSYSLDVAGNSVRFGNGGGGVSLLLQDIAGAAWTLQTPGYNLAFTNDTYGNVMTLSNNGNMNHLGSLFSGNNISLTASITAANAFISTGITTGTLTASTGITTARLLATTSISSASINSTNVTSLNVLITNSSLTNIVSSNVTTGTINATVGTFSTVNTSLLSATTITGANASLSGNLTIGGSVVAVNVTTTNLLDTNLTAGIALVTGSFAANGNSNTLGSIVTTGGNVGIGTVSPVSKLSVNGNTNISGDLTAGNVYVTSWNTGISNYFAGQFSASNNVTSASAITGFQLISAKIRSFTSQVTVSVLRSTGGNYYETFTLEGHQSDVEWSLFTSSIGDVSGINFTINAQGQILYTSTNTSSWTSTSIKYWVHSINI